MRVRKGRGGGGEGRKGEGGGEGGKGEDEEGRMRRGGEDVVDEEQKCEARTASDYVEFSNYMARDRKFPRYCGYISPFEVMSDHKFFRVTFRSNDRLDGTGFNASYYFVEETNTLSSSVRPTMSPASSSSNSAVSLSIHLLLLSSIVSCVVVSLHRNPL
ncbi:hypothetical protein WDU94_005340 [Cyamophila willieti]